MNMGILSAKKSILILALLLFAVTLQSPVTYAADPLLEKLKQKGVLTEEEASQIEKEYEKKEAKLPKGLEGVSLGALAYIDYSAGNTLTSGRQSSYNQFAVTRGYINFTKQVTPWFSVRITPDIFQETNSSSDKAYGSWLLRFKYYYAQFNLPDLGLFTNNKTELGMGHVAWLDFQEHINPYRCQGTMFQERFGNFNSSDIGIGIMGYFGGEMDEDYKKDVSKYYAGKYGSYHLGVYNGSGYHATENNNNKVVEYRVTVRPLPDVLPGLQLSYFGVTGKGNSATYTGSNAPDWRINTGLISYESKYFTVTGEVCRNKGNQSGTWTTANNSKTVEGYSLFGFGRVPGLEKLRVHGRYDYFDPDVDVSDDAARLLIAGLSYDVYKHNMAMLNYERFSYDRNHSKVGGLASADDYEHKVQLVYQVSF
jgi:hypothetical protein